MVRFFFATLHSPQRHSNGRLVHAGYFINGCTVLLREEIFLPWKNVLITDLLSAQQYDLPAQGKQFFNQEALADSVILS